MAFSFPPDRDDDVTGEYPGGGLRPMKVASVSFIDGTGGDGGYELGSLTSRFMYAYGTGVSTLYPCEVDIYCNIQIPIYLEGVLGKTGAFIDVYPSPDGSSAEVIAQTGKLVGRDQVGWQSVGTATVDGDGNFVSTKVGDTDIPEMADPDEEAIPPGYADWYVDQIIDDGWVVVDERAVLRWQLEYVGAYKAGM